MKHDKANPPPLQFFFRYISYRFVKPSTNDLKAIVELSMCIPIKTGYLYSYLSHYAQAMNLQSVLFATPVVCAKIKTSIYRFEIASMLFGSELLFWSTDG